MIGDWIVDGKLWLKQLVCRHTYRGAVSPGRALSWEECTRCERKRNWSSWW